MYSVAHEVLWPLGMQAINCKTSKMSKELDPQLRESSLKQANRREA